jgi:hypothetical protein
LSSLPLALPSDFSIPYPSLRVEKEEERRGQKESEEYLQMVK